MKHYFNPMSRGMTTQWMLTELDVPHESIVIDIHGGENDAPSFRELNPMGKVPTLVDGTTVVTETAAICAYLADKYLEKGLAPPLDAPERGSYYRYLFFPGTTLEPMFTFRQFGITDYPAQSAGWGDPERCLATIEALTPQSGWALGERFSAADVVFGGTLDFAAQFGWLEAPSDGVAAYIRRLKDRPAYRASHDPSWH